MYDVSQMAPAAGIESGVSNDAAADLWRNTLSAIPTSYGRLTYLSQVRDHNSGRYEHHGLALVFGADQAHHALRRTHLRCFHEWMSLNLMQQKADLVGYIASLGLDQAQVLQSWTEMQHWRQLVPAAVHGAERKQFIEEMKLLIRLLGS